MALPNLPTLPALDTPINIGGITGTYHGDPSQMPEITDPSGMPVPIAPARPSQTTPDPVQSWWDKYLGAFGQTQDNAIDNPNVSIAGVAGVSPNDLATGKSSASAFIIADAVSILLGLLLIAGAVFSFSQVRDTIVSTAKGAATLAA